MVLKAKLNAGKSILGTMLDLCTEPAILQLYQKCGFDFVLVDCEHAQFDNAHVFAFARMAQALGMGIIVRVPEVTRAKIQTILDFGVDGIMVPGVETPEQMEEACRLAYYAPMGKRGITIGALQDFESGFDVGERVCRYANDNLIVIAQIESRRGIENIDAILSVEGVNTVLFGPMDMSNDMGVPGKTRSDEVLCGIEKVLEAAGRHGVVTGNHIGDVESLEWGMDRGMRVIACSNDVGMLMYRASEIATRLKSHKNFVE